MLTPVARVRGSGYGKYRDYQLFIHELWITYMKRYRIIYNISGNVKTSDSIAEALLFAGNADVTLDKRGVVGYKTSKHTINDYIINYEPWQ